MAVFIVDVENVGAAWEDRVLFGKNQDDFLLFHTRDSAPVLWEDLGRPKNISCRLVHHPRPVRQANAWQQTDTRLMNARMVRMMIASELGFLIRQNPRRAYLILSRDAGLDSTVCYWQDRGVCVWRQTGDQEEPLPALPWKMEDAPLPLSDRVAEFTARHAAADAAAEAAAIKAIEAAEAAAAAAASDAAAADANRNADGSTGDGGAGAGMSADTAGDANAADADTGTETRDAAESAGSDPVRTSQAAAGELPISGSRSGQAGADSRTDSAAKQREIAAKIRRCSPTLDQIKAALKKSRLDQRQTGRAAGFLKKAIDRGVAGGCRGDDLWDEIVDLFIDQLRTAYSGEMADVVYELLYDGMAEMVEYAIKRVG